MYFEVAIGADLCAKQEAEDFLKEVPDELPFMATSCCPAWSVMAKKNSSLSMQMYLNGTYTYDTHCTSYKAA